MLSTIQKHLRPLLVAGGLTAAFLAAGSSGAMAHTHHHGYHHTHRHTRHHTWPHRVHHPRHHAPRLAQHFAPAATGDSHTLIYHIRTGILELAGRAYRAGSGNRNGYNNPAYEHVRGQGPVPEGHYSVAPRDGLFHGREAWRIEGTPGRAGILIHPASIRLRGRPIGESEGCIAVKGDYARFERDMHRFNPTRIVVMPS